MASSITLWRQVDVGRKKVGDLMRKELDEHSVERGVTADYLLDHIAYHGYAYTLNLAIIKVSQLGFSEAAPYSLIIEKAHTLGLEICPGEVGPELCTQYSDLPLPHPVLFIAMKPLKNSLNSIPLPVRW